MKSKTCQVYLPDVFFFFEIFCFLGFSGASSASLRIVFDLAFGIFLKRMKILHEKNIEKNQLNVILIKSNCSRDKKHAQNIDIKEKKKKCSQIF